MAASERVDLLLVTEPGGHLRELVELSAAWEGFRHAWVVSAPADRTYLGIPGDVDVIAAAAPTERSVRALLRNLVLARRVLRTRRPSAVVAAGAVGVPFAWVARAYGVHVIWIECAGSVAMSLSARLAAPCVHRLFVQWPTLAGALGKGEYAGSAFF